MNRQRIITHRGVAERRVDNSPWTDNVRPIPVEHLRGIFDERRMVDLRPARHVVIDPPVDWRRIANALIVAVAVGCIVYFGGQLLRAVLP